MPDPTTIQHPLLSRPGMSQRKRFANTRALDSDYAAVDGRSFVDLLDYIHRYARQIVFHAYVRGAEGKEHVELSNWLAFFEKSLPFQLARFSKIDIAAVEKAWLSVTSNFSSDPSEASLKLVLDHFFFELITPLDRLRRQLQPHEFELSTLLEGIVRSKMVSPAIRFIGLYNTAAKYFCLNRPRFDGFLGPPWSFAIEDVFAVDTAIEAVPGGAMGALSWVHDETSRLALQLLEAFRQIVHEIPPRIESSLDVLKEKHEPHVGLLFAFLRLFGNFQGDLNNLSEQHLNFFYGKILDITPREAKPDRAHLVFEVANHLNDGYRIPESLAFKDGKDGNNRDVIFGVEKELVIDKARVADLKTLILNPVKVNDQSFVEGVYIAPTANSADGKGENSLKNNRSIGLRWELKRVSLCPKE